MNGPKEEFENVTRIMTSIIFMGFVHHSVCRPVRSLRVASEALDAVPPLLVLRMIRTISAEFGYRLAAKAGAAS